MSSDNQAPSVPPVEALKQLAAKWRAMAADYHVIGSNLGKRAAKAIDICAEELEAVIDAIHSPQTPDYDLVLSNVESFMKHCDWNDSASEETAGDLLEEIRQIREDVPSPQTWQPEQVQQEFEYWMRAHNPDMPLARGDVNDPYDYVNAFVETAWEGWRAGFQASTIQAPEVVASPRGGPAKE